MTESRIPAATIRIIAEKSGKGTILSQIIDIANEAQNSKAPIQRFADKVANYFISGIVFISLLVFLAWYFYIRPGDMEQAVYCVCSVLVIACPCAFGLATPTGIMVGSGRAAELGILFKNAEQLENAYKVTDIIFNKTGTLTQGEPEVTDIIEIGEKKEKILYYAAAVEKMSEHPTALAIVNYYTKNYAIEDIVNAKDFMNIENWGVSGIVDGKTEVCICVDGKIAGMIGIADRIRLDASKAVAI